MNETERAGGKQEPVAKFKVGDPVQRAEPRSYLFPGIVIGANLKLDGKTWLYSVECIAPGVEGMVHEFTERALEARANRPVDDGLVALADKLDRIAAWHDPPHFGEDGDVQDALLEAATALRAQSDAEVERIVAWLNQLGDLWSARQIATMIERGEHRKDGV